MPAVKSDDTVGEALFRSIKDGTQPDPEAIASGDLSADALRTLSQQLQQARAEVEGEIKALSRQSAPDVDRWITEAKQLRTDARESQEHAEEISQLATRGSALRDEALDAQNKAAFLKTELAFHQSLGTTLEKIQVLWATIEQTKEAIVALKLREATENLQQSQQLLSKLSECRATGLLSLLQAQIADIYRVLASTASKLFDRIIFANREKSWIMIMEWTRDPLMDIHTIMFVLEATGTTKTKLVQLEKHAQDMLYLPRLTGTRSILCAGPFIYSTDEASDLTVESIVEDTSTMLNYFHLTLRDALVPPFMEIAAPRVVSQLLSGPLAQCVPLDLSGIPQFSKDLSTVKNFSKAMKARKWPGRERLEQWVSDAPKTWLQRRSNGTLRSVRQILSRGLGRTKAVERVETQTVAANDEVFKDAGAPDDWNASWSDEENDQEEGANQELDASKENGSSSNKADHGDTGEDAWGFGDDDEDTGTKPKNDDEDEADEAWGWGDENEGQETTESRQNSPVATKRSKSRPSQSKEQPREREVTLRETFYVTSIPEEILEIIVQVVDDAQTLLGSSSSPSNPVQPAGDGLLHLPSSVLTMFRACAPSFYETSAAGNMYMYNDSQHLSSQLRAFSTHHATHAPPSAQISLDADIAALEAFGRRAYGREMEAQRTVLRDLLDGAQGLAHCTEPPFAHECELAVSSAANRLRSLHVQWKGVVAPSALLQSTGSLYGTVTNKILVDVEDLADISEPESRKLVELCRQVEDLQALFLPDEEEETAETEGEVVMGAEEEKRAKAAMAASVYTPGLLKFQWLAQILEGSLADIRFWWTESELSLAFPSGEVIDLVEALFADSEHRRRAIGDIRKGGKADAALE